MKPDLPLAALCQASIRIAKQAGEVILEVYNSSRSLQIEHKDDETPVTNADYAAHHLIVAELEKLLPAFPVLSEESIHVSFLERSRWQTYWLVDPLDGTREFIKRSDQFSVNIALIHNHQPILGVIYVPVFEHLYYAHQNAGAWRQNSSDSAFPIQTRELNLNNVTLASSSNPGGPRQQNYIAALPPHSIIPMGSSIKSCLVAEGAADLYPRLGPTSEWDTAAAQCIVEEAGGQITHLNLKPLRYNTKASLLNPHFLVFGDPHHDWSQYRR
ncbi:MAG: 3'(2'),5'-bisphosphate nucleotidase CysQ [Gammaproteobacteria bacterium]|nr:3'(2'),5'-bisphosphate nucleotidase CysQ [Gammaproteobacteria bacterium]